MMLRCVDFIECTYFVYTKNGVTPLIIASDKGHADVVQKLLDSSADINVANKVRLFIFYYFCASKLVNVVADIVICA